MLLASDLFLAATSDLALPRCRAWVSGHEHPAVTRDQKLARARAVFASWPERRRLAAMKLLDEHGPPDKLSASDAIWLRRLKTWRAIAVSRQDGVRLVVAYSAPRKSRDELRRFSSRVGYDGRRKELSAAADTERDGLILLNLADAVARGRLTAEQARAEQARAERLELSGKSSPYGETLKLRPRKVLERNHRLRTLDQRALIYQH